MKTEILKLEEKYWDAMASKNYDVIKNLTSFPCILAGKNGVSSFDEPSFKKMFEQGEGKNITVKSISNEQVQSAEDHAIIAYIIELDYDGQVMKCACTSTWIKKGNNWLCAMHTESDLQNNN